MMLGVPMSLSDVEYVGPETYKRIMDVLSVMNNDVDDDNTLKKLELHFSRMKQLSDGDSFEVVDLIPNGRHVAVTHDNKLEYVDRVFRFTLLESVSSQLHAFFSGFYEVVPRELLMLFDPEKLDYVFCDSHEINIVDSKKTHRSKKTKKSGKLTRNDSSSSEIAEVLVESGVVALEIALEQDD